MKKLPKQKLDVQKQENLVREKKDLTSVWLNPKPSLNHSTLLCSSDWQVFTATPSSTPKIINGVNPNSLSFTFKITSEELGVDIEKILPYLKPCIAVLNEEIDYQPTVSQGNVTITYDSEKDGWFINDTKYQHSSNFGPLATIEEMEIEGWGGGFIPGVQEVTYTEVEYEVIDFELVPTGYEQTYTKKLTNDVVLTVYRVYHTFRPRPGGGDLVPTTLYGTETYVFDKLTVVLTATGISGSGVHYYPDIPYLANWPDPTPSTKLKENVSSVNFADFDDDEVNGVFYSLTMGLDWVSTSFALEPSQYTMRSIADANFSVSATNPPLCFLTHPLDNTSVKRSSSPTSFYAKTISVGDFSFGSSIYIYDAGGDFLSIFPVPNVTLEGHYRVEPPTVTFGSVTDTPSSISAQPLKFYLVETDETQELIITGLLPIKSLEKVVYNTVKDFAFKELYIPSQQNLYYVFDDYEEIYHDLYDRYVGISKDVELKCDIVYDKPVSNTDLILS